MPWCEPCEKWRSPNALLVDGTCPRCGHTAELVDHEAVTVGEARPEHVQVPAIPWHFWVMVAATALYLGWRVVQGLALLF